MNRLLVFFLAGCSSDFGLQTFEDPVQGGDDTAVSDTAAPEPAEDTDTFEETEEPEPAEEEREPPEDEPPEDDCTKTSDLIYVIDRDLERLSLFDPETLTFTHLGILDCPRGSATPGSMAISRSGTAYVRYSDNQVYAVSLDDLSCSRTGYNSGSFGAFGMGYATDDADTWRDQLYIANANQIALLSTDDWSRDVFGGMPSQSELTGTSSGELWAFLPLESPAMLAEIDKETSTVRSRIQMSNFPNLRDIDTFAFAAWGGSFWLFVRTHGMGSSTDVFRVSSSGNLNRVLEDVGFDVVGAGASTCAPSEWPDSARRGRRIKRTLLDVPIHHRTSQAREYKMKRRMFLGKIHRARVTHADLDYEGSVTIDADLMDAAGMLPYEEVHIWNVTRGTRLVTYTLEGPRGSGVICVNGAAAHHHKPDDLVILAVFGELEDEAARTHTPRVVMVDRDNRIVSTDAERPGPQMPRAIA